MDPETYKSIKHKLEKISTESFGRVLIPDFEIKEHGDGVLGYESDYIKGHTAGSREMKIIYEDVVLRQESWSFLNYDPENYILDGNGFLFYIDLEDYGEISILDRKKVFQREYKNYVTLIQGEFDRLMRTDNPFLDYRQLLDYYKNYDTNDNQALYQDLIKIYHYKLFHS